MAMSCTVVFFLIHPSLARGEEIKPATVLQPMPDFSLPAYQGGEVSISKLKGKNILLIFPRGLAGKDHWCHVCNYQYAELAELEMQKKIREKYDLEILFVLPYGKALVEDWVAKFSDQLIDIANWKNPPDQDKLDEKGRQRIEMVKKLFPKNFSYEKGEVPLPLPVLIDEGAKVSQRLGLFTTEWNGSKIEQNVPTVYVIDKNGILQMKYISQNTFDRPSPEYILRFMEMLSRNE